MRVLISRAIPNSNTPSSSSGSNNSSSNHTTVPATERRYSPTGFQPSTSFGQQLGGQVNSLATGYPQQQQQQQQQAQYSGYPAQQQQVTGYGYQQPQQTGYGYPQQQQQQLLAQFDPYGNLGQLSPTRTGTITNGAVGAPPPGVQHPRTFIQTHKAELEAWDPRHGSRFRTRSSRSRCMGGAGTGGHRGGGFFGARVGMGVRWVRGGYQTPQAQEIERLNALIKEADSNIDTVAAAALQMSEVFSGYRHSGDIASKRRVRESCNAAVTGLPEYPPPTL
ncbi:hypothetical protein BC834DRAFT_844112 [Gloeopeniophorella convolvens]|nr:hypothetical protein BC834DRAFT_844112 [Gloeopeniophorella convolvens]